MLNEKLTIIVPTFGRPKFVERVVQYSNLFGLKVVIADGSPKSLDIETIRAIEKSKHIKYFRDKSDMPARIKNAAKIVQTDFCMCMADDDLFLPSGLSAAIEKLVLDRSAVACMGQALGFDVIYGKRYFFNYGNSLKNYQLRHDNPAERLKLGIKKYRSVAFYAVFRTQDFRLIWRNIESSCCPEQIEYEHAICTFYQGNVITSDKVYWLRSFEAEPVSSDEAGKRNINFAYWYTNNDFCREVNAFNIRTSNFIARDATNLTEANKLIETTCLFMFNIYSILA